MLYMKKRDAKQLVRNEKYINYVYRVNKEFVRLCGYDALIDSNEGIEFLYSFLEDLFKIIFCKSEVNSKTVRECKRDGLLSEEDINTEFYKWHLDIINKYNELLFKLKLIRNKVEHHIDLIEFNQSSSGTCQCFSFSLKVDETIYTVDSKEISLLLIDINRMYSILEYEDEKLSKKLDMSLRYRRLCLSDYSLLYEDLDSLRKAVISII